MHPQMSHHSVCLPQPRRGASSLALDLQPPAALNRTGLNAIVPIVADDSPYLSAQGDGKILESLTAADIDPRAICAAYHHSHFAGAPAARDTRATTDTACGAKAITTTEQIPLQETVEPIKPKDAGPWFKRTRDHNPHAVVLPSRPPNEKRPPKMRSACFYLVRHAESNNNKRRADDKRAPEVHASQACVNQPTPKLVTKAQKNREPDPTLSDVGFEQAVHAAKYFQALYRDKDTACNLRPGCVVTSCMTRTLHTSKPIIRALAAAAKAQNRPAPQIFSHLHLHEEGGIFAGSRHSRRPESEYVLEHGLNEEQMKEIVPELNCLESIPRQGWWKGGMETTADIENRAKAMKEWMWSRVRSLEGENDESATIMVSHGLFCDQLLKSILDLPIDKNKYFLMGNAGYWLVRFEYLPPTRKHPLGQQRVVILESNHLEHIPEALRTGPDFQDYQYAVANEFSSDDSEDDESCVKCA